jgi:tetratricopeptide (TPR) repeat protein
MVDGVEDQVDQLAVRARRESNRGNLDEAIALQEHVVELLERRLDRLEADSEAIEDERIEAVRQLANLHGHLGSIYRRAGRMEDAVRSHRHGMELERRHRLDDSFNLTNWIALQVLHDPGRLPALSTDIEDAISLVAAQVEGLRRDQWWAWADYGLVSLLGGRIPEARRAYDRFQKIAARRVDYESVLGVLRPLRDRLAPSQPSLAAAFTRTIDTLEASADPP